MELKERLLYYVRYIMANTTVQPPAGPQALKGKNGGARPGAGHPTNAEKLVNGTLPRPVKVRYSSSPEDDAHFWQWLDEIKPDDWQMLICYVWRTAPIVDLSGGGKPITIEKIVHPFDSTYMYKTHGSGGYRFDVSQIPSDGSRQTRIRQSHQMLLDVRYPPRIPYGTWLDDARNKDWEWAKPALLEEAQKLSQPQAAEQQTPAQTLVDYLDVANKVKELSGGQENPGLTTVVIKMLENSNAALRDYQDPSKQIATLRSLMEFAGARGGNHEDASTTAMLLKMLIDQNKDLRDELRESRQNGSIDPLKSGLETVRSVLELVTGLGGGIPGLGAGRGGNEVATIIGDITTKVIEKGVEIAPAIIQAYQFGKVKDLEIAAMQQRQQQQTDKPWQMPPPTPTPAAVAPPVAVPQPAASVPPAAPGPMTAPLLFQKHGNAIGRHIQAIIDHFKNKDGLELQDYIVEREGLNWWNEFKADATPELLLEGVASHPQLKLMFTPQDKVLLFFSDLLNDDDGDDEVEDDPPIIGKEAKP